MNVPHEKVNDASDKNLEADQKLFGDMPDIFGEIQLLKLKKTADEGFVTL